MPICFVRYHLIYQWINRLIWCFDNFLVGMIMAIIEFCHKSNVESKTGKVNFSDAMRNKAKLALQGGTDSSDVDAVRFYGDSSAL